MQNNNTSEIVLAGFMGGRKGHEFYEMTEKEISSMARTHYHGSKIVPTEFSSWASSLHLVLYYAKSMPPEKNVHIAVLDSKILEPEVLVWHVPQLLGFGLHEYLAHGIVKSNGYTAVSFKDLVGHGLYDVFPELESLRLHWGKSGCRLRGEMFLDMPTDIAETAAIRRIGHLFGHLSLPVVIALACIRPRHSVDREELRRKKTASRFITLLGIEKVDTQLASEPWLRPGAVRTTGPVGTPFPDGNCACLLSRSMTQGMFWIV